MGFGEVGEFWEIWGITVFWNIVGLLDMLVILFFVVWGHFGNVVVFVDVERSGIVELLDTLEFLDNLEILDVLQFLFKGVTFVNLEL